MLFTKHSAAFTSSKGVFLEAKLIQCLRHFVCYLNDVTVFLTLRFKDHPTLNDRYLLLHLLGRGGFSEVYKVRQDP